MVWDLILSLHFGYLASVAGNSCSVEKSTERNFDLSLYRRLECFSVMDHK